MFVAMAVAQPMPDDNLGLDTAGVEFEKRVSTPAEPVGVSSGEGIGIGSIL